MNLIPLIEYADDLKAAIDAHRAILPADADGQTAALPEKAAERVSEAGRLLRTVAAREGRTVKGAEA